jgi:predicted MPP superfamily phosphohydrolase
MKKKIIIFLIILLLFIGSIILYAYFIGNSGLVVKEYTLKAPYFTENFYGLKIVHLSDIHYGTSIDNKKMQKIIKKINFIKPDIVVITGDLFDKNTKLTKKEKTSLIDNLSKIEAFYGKYIIKGNHDIYKDWGDVILESGFTDLNNTYTYLYNASGDKIFLGGINSEDKLSSIKKTIKEFPLENNVYNILLTHKTDLIDNIDYQKFNLILGGHSHNGQVRLPFIGAFIKPKGSKKYYDEYYSLGETDVFISSGLGTSGLKLRLFNKPSFNLYRLTNKA